MKTNATAHIYALLPITAELSETDLAPLKQALNLAQDKPYQVHALLSGRVNQDILEQIKHCGPDVISILQADTASSALQAHQIADLFANVMASGQLSLSEKDLFLIAANDEGELIAGQLAARIHAVPLGKCSHIELDENQLFVKRAAFGGRLNLTLSAEQGPFIAAVRAQADFTLPALSVETAIQDITVPSSLPPALAKTHIERQEEHAGLDGAKLIVSGGRGIGNQENFNILYELATELEGAVGGSLPAIDAGWAPVSRQVGQSGKYVSPEYYLAVGISGTPQHLAGISPHAKIIAINNDLEASIFSCAHMGVVADLNAFLPALLHELRTSQ